MSGARPHRAWRWRDRRSDSKDGSPYFHAVAAVYEVGEREVALIGLAPSNVEKVVPEEMAILAKLVASLEPWSGPSGEQRFSYYNIAASCQVQDREVGIVVYVPIGKAAKPDKEFHDFARRIAGSLTPVDKR